MKKIKINVKKLVFCFLAIFCLANVHPINYVSAQEETSGGAKLKSENDFFEREENMIRKLKKKKSQLSQSQKKDLEAKMKIINEENNSLKVERNACGSSLEDDELVSTETIYPARKLNMKSCKQINGYYCGPATTKQTLQYLTGKSYKQGDIAKALGTTKDGTDGTQIVKYLNMKQKKVNYMISTTTNTAELKKRICHDITIADAPPIVRLKFVVKEDNNSLFSTKGHFLNISGYSRGIKKVQLTDPNIRRLFGNDKTGKYNVTIKELRQALIDHPNHHMYW